MVQQQSKKKKRKIETFFQLDQRPLEPIELCDAHRIHLRVMIFTLVQLRSRNIAFNIILEILLDPTPHEIAPAAVILTFTN